MTQLDGKLPNLALMRLAHWHRDRGDEIAFTTNAARGMFEQPYDNVYGSAIFTRSAPLVDRLRRDFPNAVLGGPGAFPYRAYDPSSFPTVEATLGVASYEKYDYSIYPRFSASLGYLSRGCRSNCDFCPVPAMEGKVRAVASINEIWRGDPFPKHLHLLDNDFFGQPRWRAIIDAAVDGGFKLCVNQGINVRVLRPAIALEVARMPLYDDSFSHRRIYTAWDNIGDEQVVVSGLRMLFDAGIRPDTVMVYMLIGFDQHETEREVFHRFNILSSLGVRVYPMPYNEQIMKTMADGQMMKLKAFQRWVVSGAHVKTPWSDYRVISQSERDRLHRLRREEKHQLPLLAAPA